MKIQTKIFSIIFILSLVTGIVAITSCYIVSKQMIETDIYHHLESVAASGAHYIETLLNTEVEQVKTFATDKVFIDVFTTQNLTPAIQRIKTLVNIHNDISQISVLDKQGNVVVSSHSKIDSIRHAEIFANGKEGIYIHDVHISAITGTKVINISAPILAKGEFVGLIIVDIEVEAELYEIISYRHEKTDETYLINKEGYMITPSRFMADTFLKQKVASLEARKCFTTSEINDRDIYEDYRGELVIGTHYLIDGINWCLLAEIDAKEAFLPVNRLVQLMFSFFISLLGVSGILAFFISKSITRPIVKLQHRAYEIKKGNWDYPVTVDTQDEIGYFSRAFDRMTTQLKNAQDELQSHQDKLEVKVKERTAELQQEIFERQQIEIELKQYHDHLEELVKERTTELNQANERLQGEITERKQAEKALRHSEKQFRKLFEEGPIGMVIATADHHFTDVNTAFCHMLGYTEAELLQLKVTDISYPDEMPENRELMQKALNGEIPFYQMEKRYLRKDGELVWGNLAVSFFHNDEGEVTHFLGKVEDITVRKQAEEKLLKSETMLLHAQNIAHLGNWEWEINSERQIWSEEHYRILGYEPYTIEASFDHFMSRIHPDDRILISNSVDVLLTQKTQQENNEFRVILPDGNERVIQSTITGSYDDVGQPIKLAGTTLDITERKRVEFALKQAKDEADAANRAKSEFLANMSHEIRTPMNAVIGFSDILASKVTDNKQKSYLNSIQTAGKSLLTLINDILDLSKIEAGRLDIQYEPVSPQVIFTELQQIFSLKMAEKNLELIMEIDESLSKALFLDETRLRQVLLNLIGNAIKFTDSGYIKLCANKIETEDFKSQVDLILAVEDSGIGIPADQQALIFESFRQQDGQSTRQYGGTGLGLAITKRLVEMMNGHISVDSRFGKGSRFEIALHEVKVAASRPTVRQDNSFDFNNITFEKAQVLVVDDIESNRDLIEEYLSQVNLEVICAENGQEALLFVEEYHPTLILMDLRMPEMDGYEATKQLKDHPNTADIPIIALTASATLNEKAKTEAHGFDGFLAKPVNFSELLSELSHYLKYTQKAVAEVPQVATVGFDSTLNLAEIAELNELRNKLKQEVMPVWKKANVIMEMEIVADIAEKMIELGNEYNIPVFIQYGERLLESSQTFKIAYIQKALKEFPVLVKPLMEVGE